MLIYIHICSLFHGLYLRQWAFWWCHNSLGPVKKFKYISPIENLSEISGQICEGSALKSNWILISEYYYSIKTA